MNNAIKLLDEISKDMEYIKLLLTEPVPPLSACGSVIWKLAKLRGMLDNEFLTPEQIREAVRRLEKPISDDPSDGITAGDDLALPTSTGNVKV